MVATFCIFRSLAGRNIAICEADIVSIWEGEKPGRATVQLSNDIAIEVEYDFAKDILRGFHTADMTPRKKKTKSKKARMVHSVIKKSPKAGNTGNIVHLKT
jgi:hypothetical protein